MYQLQHIIISIHLQLTHRTMGTKSPSLQCDMNQQGANSSKTACQVGVKRVIFHTCRLSYTDQTSHTWPALNLAWVVHLTILRNLTSKASDWCTRNLLSQQSPKNHLKSTRGSGHNSHRDLAPPHMAGIRGTVLYLSPPPFNPNSL